MLLLINVVAVFGWLFVLMARQRVEFEGVFLGHPGLVAPKMIVLFVLEGFFFLIGYWGWLWLGYPAAIIGALISCACLTVYARGKVIQMRSPARPRSLIVWWLAAAGVFAASVLGQFVAAAARLSEIA